MSDPRKKQIGGDHYKKMVIQPSDYIVKNNLGWYEGNIVKYITRHSVKGGKQDIEKVIHYAQLLIEDQYVEKETEEERMGRKTARHVRKLNKQWKKEKEADERHV